MKIIWRGNDHTNFSDRKDDHGKNHIPVIIVDHVSGGSASSCDSWFRSSGNKVSSAHYLVSKKGEIFQYVKIEDMAWANGLKFTDIAKAPANIIRTRGINPNYYSISIEHEGFDGYLTPAQMEATVWLHKHIREEVKRIYGYEIPMNRDHILGHFEIDPKRKPNCPGPRFPWNELISGLNRPSIAKDQCWIMVNEKYLQVKGLLKDGTSYLPVRTVAEAFGKGEWVGFCDTTKRVILHNHVLESTNILGGIGYAWSREIAEVMDLALNWDESTKTVVLKEG